MRHERRRELKHELNLGCAHRIVVLAQGIVEKLSDLVVRLPACDARLSHDIDGRTAHIQT